jgi:hypothetical protein
LSAASPQAALRRAATVACALVLGIFGICLNAQAQSVREIKFDLGKNIVETARGSGVPSFSTRDIAGLVSYSVNGIPRQIQVHYTRPGFEIYWSPVFALTMYASRSDGPALAVDTVDLILNIDEMNDEQAHAFVEQTIAQFQKGKWKRYSDPEWDVLLTGRSSILNEDGEVDTLPMTIDPNYRIPANEWRSFALKYPIWRWVGDGILATFDIANSPGQDGKDAYRMNLSFENLDVKLKLDAKNLAEKLAEGDAKGWNSTAEYEASKKAQAEKNKRLIANAIKRGDSVVEP